MTVDSFQVQLSSALQRFASLQQKARSGSVPPGRLLQQALRELELALEELQVAQDHLIGQRDELTALHQALVMERRRYWTLFDETPDACVVTSPDDRIIEANRAASELLNISQRFLVGKPFSLFVCSDRERIILQARRLAESAGTADWTFSLRPRERAPLTVSAHVVAGEEDGGLRWLIRRLQPVPAEEGVASLTPGSRQK